MTTARWSKVAHGPHFEPRQKGRLRPIFVRSAHTPRNVSDSSLPVARQLAEKAIKINGRAGRVTLWLWGETPFRMSVLLAECRFKSRVFRAGDLLTKLTHVSVTRVTLSYAVRPCRSRRSTAAKDRRRDDRGQDAPGGAPWGGRAFARRGGRFARPDGLRRAAGSIRAERRAAGLNCARRGFPVPFHCSTDKGMSSI